MNKQNIMNAIEAFWTKFEAWFLTEFLTLRTLIEAGIILLVLGVAWVIHRPIETVLRARAQNPRSSVAMKHACTAIANHVLALVFALLLGIMVLGSSSLELPTKLSQIAFSLAAAWVVINLATSLLRSRSAARVITIIAWTVAALNIVGFLDDAIAALDSVAFKIGDVRVSTLTVINAVILVIVLVWLANFVSGVFAQRVKNSKDLTPSVQVLVTQLLRIVLIVVAVLIAIDTVGIDLSALAVFGGALGVGLGFGLQKIVSNFISGIILLLDKSIKPGDVISVEGTYGQIISIHARYASVLTRDGHEILIPNELLITERVRNWSFTDKKVRLKIPVGISYDADVEKAIELCIEAAGNIPRVQKEPKTVCLVKGFGDSSVDMELRIWIDDPEAGQSNVKSLVYREVWRLFHEHDIEIPYPQRDLHVRSGIEFLKT